MPLMAIRPSPALDTTGPPRPSVVVSITAAPYLGSDPFDLEDQAGNAGRAELGYVRGGGLADLGGERLLHRGHVISVEFGDQVVATVTADRLVVAAHGVPARTGRLQSARKRSRKKGACRMIQC